MAAYRLCLALVLLSSPVWSQTNRYMVFFSDKVGTPHLINQPSTFLSDRAMLRRTKAVVTVTDADLPVTPNYVTQVRAAGAKAFFTTRWMNGVLIEATPTIVTMITAMPFVSSVEYVAPNQRLLGGRKGSQTTSSSATGSTDDQLHMLGIDSMHKDGYRGEGVMIAILDSGFPGVESTAPFQGIRDGNQIKLTTDFITNSASVYQFDDHGTLVFSTIAAQTTSFNGGATKAEYLLFVTEDEPTEYRIEEYNWLFAAERADSAGADIIQSSVAYSEFDDPAMDYTTADLNGTTAIVSQAAGFARDRGIIVVTSADNLGNAPWQFITFPADTRDILAVGALTSSGSKASFSSIGPTTDGRIKPDVAGLGVGVCVIRPSGETSTADGTSFSAPLVTSLVAGLIQAFPDIKPIDLVVAIKRSATQYWSPDNLIGFGIPNYLAVRNFLKSNGGDGLYAYPNPATSTLWLSMPTFWDVVDLVINDHLGKVVWDGRHQITWSTTPLPIDVSALNPGVYVVRIILGTATISFRFVKI